jgi:xanthine phosphoribosyltransferase
MSVLLQALHSDGSVADGLVEVDRFLNHRVLPDVMAEVGAAVSTLVTRWSADVILTAEASGIPPATAASLASGVPMVYAKKFVGEGGRNSYSRGVASPTKGMEYRVEIARHVLEPGLRVAIVDDFLSGGRTAAALVELAREAGCEVMGAVFVIEKAWMPGRALVESLGCPVHALATVLSIESGVLQLAAS